jgi:adenosine kinase
MKVVITGSIAFDYLMSFPGKFAEHLLADKLHKVSVSFLVDSLLRLPGGVAPNIAYTNALLGGHPKIMATAGQDFKDYRLWLEEHGVDTSGILVLEDDYCASFFVNTDEDLNQIASFYTGAMAHADQLSFAKNAADAELAVISPNDPKAMVAYVAECKSLGLPFIYDPSQQIIRLSGEQLQEGLTGCVLLTVNEYELYMIQEKTGLSEDDIESLAGGVLITKGENGSQIRIDHQTYDIPAVLPDKVVEPTGAGDAFRGGLLRGIQLSLPWEVAGRMGALAATYVLENIGPQGHSYTPAEFVERYRQVFGNEDALEKLLA